MPKMKKGAKKDKKLSKGRDGFKPRGKRPFVLRKKKCKFCGDKNQKINYLDSQFLRRFTTERGKIIPSRITGTCARHQRKLAKAIKRARNIGLLAFLSE